MVRRKEDIKELLKNEIIKLYNKEGLDTPNLEFVLLKKNNSTVTGLSVRYANSDILITPVFHVSNTLSQLMNDDISIEEAALDIFDFIQSEKEKPIELTKSFREQYCKENLLLEVVSNKNKDFLEGVVYTEDEILGLAYIVRMKIDNIKGLNKDVIQNCIVTKNFLKELCITKEQLFNDVNAKLQGYVIHDMFDFLVKAGWFTPEEKPENIDPRMYVITNKEQLFGASILYFPDQLAQILMQKNIEKAIILPSSVHELIATPYCKDIDLDTYTAMVKLVNATQVIPEERLVDHAYLFDVETKEFSII